MSAIQAQDEGILEDDNTLENQSEETETQESEPENESAMETARRAFDELQRDGQEDEEAIQENKSLSKSQDNKLDPKDKTKKPIGAEDFDPELSPPERLKAHEKQMFNNLPKGLKRAYNRSVKELEAMGTGRAQEIAKKESRYKEIEEVIDPLVIEWGEMGLSPAQGMRELVAAQKRLTHPDMSEREKAFQRMAQGCGIDLARLGNPQQQATNSSVPDISNHPTVVALNQQLTHLRSMVEPINNNFTQSLQQQQQQAQSQNTADMESVRDEIDPRTGNYVRPDLHDEEFIRKIGSSVAALQKAAWEVGDKISAGEALKRVHDSLKGSPQAFRQSNQTRTLTNGTQNNIQQRATNAAVSVRGRSTPSNISTDPLGDIPPEALSSPLETTKWVARQLSRGY
jgi:hypothetical protein